MTLPAREPHRLSQSAKILAVLHDGEAHSAAEIHRICGPSRLNSRIAELRKRGHVIACERDSGKSGPEAYVYTLSTLSPEAPSLLAPIPSPASAAASEAGQLPFWIDNERWSRKA